MAPPHAFAPGALALLFKNEDDVISTHPEYVWIAPPLAL